MKNIFKGYVTTFFGLAIMILDTLYFFGIVKLPYPSEMLSKGTTVGVAFLVGLALFLIPATRLEEMIEKRAGDKLDKL